MNESAARNFVLAQAAVATALLKMEAMKAENSARERQGKVLAYGEHDFLKASQAMNKSVLAYAGHIQ